MVARPMVTIHRRTVHKQFTKQIAWEKELQAYRTMPWATPKLIDFGPMWIEVERCTPILNIHPNWSRRYAEPLWDLLAAIHAAGWWHCDPCLINVVVHPDRGVLLIDFENLTLATGNRSYDLYGATRRRCRTRLARTRPRRRALERTMAVVPRTLLGRTMIGIVQHPDEWWRHK
ncbi:kinase [Mycobacterium phage MilleniumForce]|uniref:Serine/threonine kinase n=1 Tax=Mycobacterium phage MilleniumForce TaxID=2315711 RepID=A0A386KRS9_9CAUD|nr:kinase [Mycobacterium phage MilleniumForce]AYD86927.1 serine/threonine kinase [Mycobacterium phage MilleniumForce]